MARTAKNKTANPSLFEDGSGLSFEEALLKLETIVKEMEAGELALEDALSKFADGIFLSKIALSKINSAQEQIDKLLEEEPGSSNLILKPLNYQEGCMDK